MSAFWLVGVVFMDVVCGLCNKVVFCGLCCGGGDVGVKAECFTIGEPHFCLSLVFASLNQDDQ